MGKFVDLTGEKFGRLTVLSPTDERRNEKIVWKCQCDCGNIHYAIAVNLKSGSVRSCGCLKKENLAKQNSLQLIGKKFFRLLVVEKDNSIQDGNSHWICKCDCGNTISVKGALLTSGGVKSCGCLQSVKESEISQILIKNNINFERQKSFDSCRFEDTNRKAKFDFYLPDENILIEYDGIQHFEYRGTGWNTEENFEKTQSRDEYKNKWAKENNIPLLRLNYKDGNLEELILKFLRKENEVNE